MRCTMHRNALATWGGVLNREAFMLVLYVKSLLVRHRVSPDALQMAILG